MKQKFREWKPRKKMVITYKDPDSNNAVKKVELDGVVLLDFIINTIDEYEELGLKLTNREMYYQLVGAAAIPNAMEVYKRFCVFLTNARYGGFIDWDAIEDRSRSANKHPEWDDVPDLIESAVASYRLKRWEDQEYYLEMYCEKEAGEGKLKPVADKYHIHFGANKGYASASMMYEMSQRIKEQLAQGKKVVLLYFGDHDPSGLDMIRDVRTRILEFIKPSFEDFDKYCSFEVVPVALNREQIKKYKCPPNPAKITDPRAKWYIQEHGKVSWELDALKPTVLIKLAEDSILEYIDLEAYNKVIAEEKNDIEALREFGEQYTDE